MIFCILDIMGVVEDFENAKPIKTMYDERNIARFRITDGRYYKILFCLLIYCMFIIIIPITIQI